MKEHVMPGTRLVTHAAAAAVLALLATAPGAAARTIIGTPAGETLRGTRAADVIKGGGGNDRLEGRGSADRLDGGTGSDKLAGGPGADRLLGGGGRDTLDGGPGDDRLDGGAGDDVVRGGPGRDTITVGAGADGVDCGGGRDTLVIRGAVGTVRGCETVRRPPTDEGPVPQPGGPGPQPGDPGPQPSGPGPQPGPALPAAGTWHGTLTGSVFGASFSVPVDVVLAMPKTNESNPVHVSVTTPVAPTGVVGQLFYPSAVRQTICLKPNPVLCLPTDYQPFTVQYMDVRVAGADVTGTVTATHEAEAANFLSFTAPEVCPRVQPNPGLMCFLAGPETFSIRTGSTLALRFAGDAVTGTVHALRGNSLFYGSYAYPDFAYDATLTATRVP
jgi:Ca2+-binding RTX toxin-like protein